LASRTVAEEAQKKAEAHLGRVSQLEAEVLALRSAPVPAQTKSPATAPASPPSAAPARNSVPPSHVSPTVPAPARRFGLVTPLAWNSAIVPDLPELFQDFKQNHFTPLWRGSCDGFGAGTFHNRCDGHPNTLTVILDTNGNIFGGFTPVEWECRAKWPWQKADLSLKSFLFTLKNPHNLPARRFPLKAEMNDQAIECNCLYGPHFCDIRVFGNCNTNTKSSTYFFGEHYTNDTGQEGETVFTGSKIFQVKEIEVIEITD
jgi:hypothetical protein